MKLNIYSFNYVEKVHVNKLSIIQSEIYEIFKKFHLSYSETLNNEYIERIHQMSYSSQSDNGMLQIFSFLIK